MHSAIYQSIAPLTTLCLTIALAVIENELSSIYTVGLIVQKGLSSLLSSASILGQLHVLDYTKLNNKQLELKYKR